MNPIEIIERHLMMRLGAPDVEQVRHIEGQFAFELNDAAKSWVIDFDQYPPVLRQPVKQKILNSISLSSSDLLQTIADPIHCFVRAWQGRLRLAGNTERWRLVFNFLFPSADTERSRDAGLYASIARLIPDQRLGFMNLGLATAGEGGQPLTAGGDGEPGWQHCIELLQHTIESVEIDGRDVIDIGCGRGGPASLLAARHPSARITGVDYCADSIAICREHAAADNLDYMCASADQLPCSDASFDVVINLESSHGYPTLAGFYREVDRVLKAGGTFCYADTFTRQSLRRAQAGLQKISHWRQLRTCDISVGVADSLRQNREKMREFFASMVNLYAHNQALICSLIDSGNEQMENKYRNRELIYQSWQFQK